MINKILPKTEFSKNVLNVVGGTAVSQLITIALSPVLSRLYSPDDFGVYSIFITLAATTAVISTFRYEFAIMLPKEEDEAVNVVALSFFINLLYTFLTLLVFLIGGKPFLHLIHSDAIEPYILLVAVYVLFFGAMGTLNYWLSRVKMFRELSYGKVAQSAGTAIFSIAFFYLGMNHGGLIAGAVIGQACIGLMYIFYFRKDWLRLKLKVSREKMKVLFNRYIHFLTFNTPHALLNVGQDLVVAALINFYFGTAAAGLYFLTYRILRLPAGVIGASTAQVFYQRVSELHPDVKAMQHQILKVYKQLFVLSIPIFGVLLIGGPLLFSFAFGEKWYDAGVYAQILSPSLMLAFILAPVTAITVVVRMQHYSILFGVADILLRTASILIGGYYHNIYVALYCLSGSSCLFLIYALYWFYHVPASEKAGQYH